MELDVLAFGPHPDDVEIGAGGILALHAQGGYRCGIVDMTAGEMASNGTVEERKEEAARAAEILNCPVRECLGLPDAHLEVNTEAVYRVVKAVRTFRPKIILAPFYWDDRHPDHSAAGELVKRATYLSGLRRYPVEGTPFRPQKIFYYLLSVRQEPALVVDISAVYDRKEEAIRAHQSQFYYNRDDKSLTLVNDPVFLRFIRNRDSYFGSLIGSNWGEGLIPGDVLSSTDLLKML